jgi:hypothetical protein
MDSTTMIQLVSGVMFALVLGILIQRRRTISSSRRSVHTISGQGSGV